MAEVAIEKRFEIEVRDLEYQRIDGVPLLGAPLPADQARKFRRLVSGRDRRAWRRLGVGRPAQQRAAR